MKLLVMCVFDSWQPSNNPAEIRHKYYFSRIISSCSINFHTIFQYRTGPSCSKLRMSLVNVSFKFQTLISDLRQYFLLNKCEKLLQCKSFSHFFNKNISVFAYKVVKHLTS